MNCYRNLKPNLVLSASSIVVKSFLLGEDSHDNKKDCGPSRVEQPLNNFELSDFRGNKQ